MAEPSYHGALGVGQYPVRRSHEHIPPHSAFMPPLQASFAAPRQTQIIVPLIFVPRLYIGSPVEIAGLLSAPALQAAGAYLFLRPATPLDRAEIRIGEGRNVAMRLQQSIDSWLYAGFSAAIIIACDHSGFSKEFAETLELRLTSRVESTGHIKVLRDRAPKVRHLSVGEHRAVDDMLEVVTQELERLGLNFLSPRQVAVNQATKPFVPEAPKGRDLVHEMLGRLDLTRPPSPMTAPPLRVHEPARSRPRPAPWEAQRYVLHYDGLEGTLQKLGPQRFEIAAGTQVSTSEVPALGRKYRAIRKNLRTQGAIGPDRKRGEGLWVLRPTVVTSGAIAAAVVSGSTKASTRVWRAA